MSNLPAIIIFVVIFGGVIAIVIVSAIRRREIAFAGVVIDKAMHENVVNDSTPGQTMITTSGRVTHTYSIRVKTDAGKDINYSVSSGIYETIKIGDRVTKPSGTTDLTIAAATPVQPVAPATPAAPTPVPPVDTNSPR